MFQKNDPKFVQVQVTAPPESMSVSELSQGAKVGPAVSQVHVQIEIQLQQGQADRILRQVRWFGRDPTGKLWLFFGDV